MDYKSYMNMNIRGIEKELVLQARVCAMESGLTLRDWVIVVITEAVNGPRKTEGVEPSSSLSRVRSGVRERRERDGISKVRGPQHTAQPNPGTMGERVRDDSEGQGKGQELSVMDRPYQGPAHSPTCKCTVCTLKRGGK